jgi:signal transduction histidine kinase/CheY-like chemotaxis protein
MSADAIFTGQMRSRASPPVRLLAVVRPGESDAAVRELDAPDRAVAVAASVDELTAALDGDARIDCVVCRYDLVDGTGTDVLARVSERRPDVPVVLCVEATDGRVPAGAVSGDFAARVVTDGTTPIEGLTEAVDAAVEGHDEEAISGRLPPAGWSTDAWKASVLDQLFERLPLHVFVKDRDGRIALVTEGPVEERLHPFGDQFRGKRDIDGVVPFDEALGSYVDDLQVIGLGDPVVDEEEYFASSGRWFLTTKIPLHDETDDVVGLLGITREITERKERELQLTALNHLVRHNLRNEVNVIRGWAEVLHGTVGEEHRTNTDRIVRASDRLLSTIDKQQETVDVLTECAGPVTLDAAALARRITDDAADRYPDARVDRTAPENAPIRVVEGFGRAVGELVENAIVHNARDAPLVDLHVEPRDERVRIRVADDGPPIPEMEVATLTGERSIEPLYHGTGLGLWMVNWIVRRSDGTLAFEPNDPRGNVVAVSVPATD